MAALNRIEFSITTYCQASCPSCLRTLLDKENKLTVKHTPIERIESAIKNLQNLETVELCGELGDPMMHPDIEQIIDMLTERGVNVIVHTNGGLRTPDFYKHLGSKKRNAGVLIKFGIDGMDAETNEKYRTGVDWQRAWDNMHAWFSITDDVNYAGVWQFIIFEHNKHQVDAAYEYTRKNKINMSMRVNRRTYSYVGDEEKKQLEEKIEWLNKKT